MSCLVSVCLPVWNGENFLESAILSVLTQTHHNLELIVIDDCSTDDSPKIIERLQAEDSRIKYYRNEHRLGLFENYNRCMSLSTGDFIKPFAQDDLLEPTHIEQMLQLANSHTDIALLSCSRKWIDAKGADLSETHGNIPSASDLFPAEKPLDRARILQHSIFPIINLIGEPAAVLFPRTLIGKGFDSRFKHLGDLEYWLRLLESGKYLCSPEKLCSIRNHSKRQTIANYKSLSVAADYIQLAEIISPSVRALGYSTESFFRSCLFEVAQQLNHMSNNEIIDFAKEQHAAENPLYEVALQSLLLLAKTNHQILHPDTEKQIYFNERHIVRRERYLRRILSDAGWHWTRPLRELSKIGTAGKRGNILTGFRNGYAADATRQTVLQQQSSYLNYLRITTSKVKQSYSWKIIVGLNSIFSSLRCTLKISSTKPCLPLFDKRIYAEKSPQLAIKSIRKQTRSTSRANNQIKQSSADLQTDIGLNKNVHLSALSGTLVEQYTQLCRRAPLLPSLAQLNKISELKPTIQSAKGKAYFKLASLIKTPFKSLFLVGDFNTSITAADVEELALRRGQNPNDILILFTDGASKRNTRTESASLIHLSDVAADLSLTERVDIIVRLTVQSAPGSVFNLGSQTAWKAYRNFHRQLKRHTSLKVCLQDSPNEANPVSKTELENLYCCFDFIDEVHTASVEQIHYLINNLSLETFNHEKLFLPITCQTENRSLRDKTILKELRVSILETESFQGDAEAVASSVIGASPI
ncbi:MAG: glycosyltransferase family 2 protein [Candidatus Obscuribacterales bacterium]|nr:glycosyltransferase family 2 protein [Candidatus Obscuribacterales bacterium]